MILFDGEEAFTRWQPFHPTSPDALYGSRHLAQKWETEGKTSYSTYNSIISVGKLGDITEFVLLDLIGGNSMKIRNRCPSLGNIYWCNEEYDKLMEIENQFSFKNKIFQQTKSYSSIGDDHLPFYNRG